MNDLERTAHETEALNIAIHLRMSHGAGAAAFRAALGVARDYSGSTSSTRQALHVRAGGLLVELGVLSEADALAICEEQRAGGFLPEVQS